MGNVRKALFLTFGTVFVVLGLIGIFIPILPTTPFLLLAAFFFARSSDRALQWLLHNRWFGSYIRNYREGRGMTARNKAVTLLMLWIAIAAAAIFFIENPWARVLLFLIASGVTFHLLRIQTYRPNNSPGSFENGIE